MGVIGQLFVSRFVARLAQRLYFVGLIFSYNIESFMTFFASFEFSESPSHTASDLGMARTHRHIIEVFSDCGDCPVWTSGFVFIAQMGRALLALISESDNHSLKRIRAPLCAQWLLVIHRFLSAQRPLSARIAELGRWAS